MTKSRFIWEEGDIEIQPPRDKKEEKEKRDDKVQDKGGSDADQATKG